MLGDKIWAADRRQYPSPENGHLPIGRQEGKQQRFKSRGPAQHFLSTLDPIYNLSNPQTHLISGPRLRTLRTAA